MKSKQRNMIPLAILGSLGLIAVIIKLNPPPTEQRASFSGPVMVVDATPINRRDYVVKLQSYGTVQPRTETTLIAQVGGQIISVNENVRDGGFFEKGDVLATIDPRDYEANVRIAEAVLMDARQALAEAEARSNQAREDWERLGNDGVAPDLVLKVPQLNAAKARIISAESTLQKALLDLERTQIIAPFAGRIRQKHADIGQVVSGNTPLADIYATDYVEIRLPLRNRDLGFIDLPEAYRFEDSAAPVGGVKIYSELIGNAAWDAKLVRTEGAIDATARQLHVIAQIDDPFKELAGQTPPKIGQYVTAELTGKTLSDVLVIPNSTIYQGSYVYIVQDNLLQRRDIQIAWQNDLDAIIEAGLDDGDMLVTTTLGQVTSGLRVAIAGQERLDRRQAGGPPDNMTTGANQ